MSTHTFHHELSLYESSFYEIHLESPTCEVCKKLENFDESTLHIFIEGLRIFPSTLSKMLVRSELKIFKKCVEVPHKVIKKV